MPILQCGFKQDHLATHWVVAGVYIINASENDLRSFVTKRKISGGTMSRNGRVARDTMLGLLKSCRKLNLSFWHYLGDRLGIAGEPVPQLAGLVAARA